MKFLTKKDHKAIHAGARLAMQHAKMIEYHQIEHSLRHELIEDFDCHEFNRDFYQGLGKAVEAGNPSRNHFFQASYNSTGERLARKLARTLGGNLAALKENMGSAGAGFDLSDLTKMFPGATVIPMEPPQEGETEEQFIARLKQMAEDADVFKEQVSETRNTPNTPDPRGDDRKTIFDLDDDKITFTPEEEAAEPEGAAVPDPIPSALHRLEDAAKDLGINLDGLDWLDGDEESEVQE